MVKSFTCIECPKGCRLTVNIFPLTLILSPEGRGKGEGVSSVTGNECPKGEVYAVSEIESPSRVLTATVLAEGLDLKMIPVRTDKPIPKNRIFEAMDEVKKIKAAKALNTGDIIVKNFLGLDVNLVATRKTE